MLFDVQWVDFPQLQRFSDVSENCAESVRTAGSIHSEYPFTPLHGMLREKVRDDPHNSHDTP